MAAARVRDRAVQQRGGGGVRDTRAAGELPCSAVLLLGGGVNNLAKCYRMEPTDPTGRTGELRAVPSAEDINDALFLLVARWLPAPDLVSLTRAARRFWEPRFGSEHAGDPAERWSLPAEAARLHLVSLPQAEQDWAPRRAPPTAVEYVRRLGEIERLGLPLRFTQSGPALHHNLAEGTPPAPTPLTPTPASCLSACSWRCLVCKPPPPMARP